MRDNYKRNLIFPQSGLQEVRPAEVEVGIRASLGKETRSGVGKNLCTALKIGGNTPAVWHYSEKNP